MVNLANIKCKEYCCSLNGQTPQKIEDAILSMYVVLTRQCNVRCKFCTFRGNVAPIDLACFETCVRQLRTKFDLGKIQFTGGEPTLELATLRKCLEIVKKYDSLCFTSINTNGKQLLNLIDMPNLDNVALSRHSVSIDEHFTIMQSTDVATDEDIRTFCERNSGKLHLSCNLIRGYVDSVEKIVEYLEYAANLGVDDVGFVSLMPVNNYCKEHFVDFSDLHNDIEKHNRFINNKTFEQYSNGRTGTVTCRCKNYLYRATNGRIVAMYSRFVCQHKAEASYVVYENNELLQGFGGKKLM